MFVYLSGLLKCEQSLALNLKLQFISLMKNNLAKKGVRNDSQNQFLFDIQNSKYTSISYSTISSSIVSNQPPFPRNFYVHITESI